MRHGSAMRAILTGLIAIGVLASPAAAGAHLRSGTVAVDYRATVWRAETPAYSAQIFQSDRALSLTVRPGHVITLIGYLGEPVFRLDSAGLWINAASPTAVVLRLVARSQRVVSQAARWHLDPHRRSVVWHDARTQSLPLGMSEGSWSVPLIVDGTRTTVRGELWRYPAPRWWLWLALLAILLAIGGSPILLRRRALYGPGASACAVIAATAAIVIVVAFASDAYASPGAWIEGADATAFLVVGVWVLLCGPARWRMAAAAGAGLVALAVGLLEGAIFLHPIVLAILPATVIRTADTLAIAAGVGAALLGGLCYLDTPLPNPAVAPRGPGRSAPPGHRTADRTSHA